MLTVPWQGHPALVILRLSVAGGTGKHAGPLASDLQFGSRRPPSLLAVLRWLRLETSWKGPGAVAGANPPKENRLC